MVVEVLSERGWRARRSAHERRVDAWVGPHLERRSRGDAHPVEDFLFTYYRFSPAALRRWHPGLGTRLVGEGAGEFGEVRGYVVDAGGAGVDPALPALRQAGVAAVRRLLAATAGRPPALVCFGLHEWAMVYRQPAERRRHPSYPLRLGAAGTDQVVEDHRVCCTHYDAFRFFTAGARGRNALTLSRESQPAVEQPGCLHATMDLYRWAYQLTPFASAELVADCFALAREVRVVDMRASPYDLSGLGVEPIEIESAAGKGEYVAAQRAFADRARPLRGRLVEVCDQVLAAAERWGGSAEGSDV